MTILKKKEKNINVKFEHIHSLSTHHKKYFHEFKKYRKPLKSNIRKETRKLYSTFFQKFIDNNLPSLANDQFTVKIILCSTGKNRTTDFSNVLFKIKTKLYVGKNEICSIGTEVILFNMKNKNYDNFLNSIFNKLTNLLFNSSFERNITKRTKYNSIKGMKTKVGLKYLYSKKMKNYFFFSPVNIIYNYFNKHHKLFKLDFFAIDYDLKSNTYPLIILQNNGSKNLIPIENITSCKTSMDVLQILQTAGLVPFDIENQTEKDVLNMMNLINY